jgi:synaptic vesicle membrane protein VAT-1
MSLDKAAALPVNYATSFFAMVEQARVRSSDRVMIDCASGGVGVLSIQLVQSLGAKAIGLTGSAHKKEFISELGAEAFTHEEFRQSKQKVDVILNSLGGSSISEHFRHLAPNGRIVCIGASQMVSNGLTRYLKALKLMWEMPKFSMMQLFNANKGVFGLNVLKLMEHPHVVEKAFHYMGENVLNPIVDSIFPAADAAKAHAYIQDRKAKGKVLLEWP